MTITKAKSTLAKDMRCKEKRSCYQRCVDCKNYVTDGEVSEAEKVVLEWIDNQQEHIKQQQLSGSYYDKRQST